MNNSQPVNAIEVEGLNKTYRGNRRIGPKRALKDVSLNIPRGSFFGLLGPNGAGKSTLINILAGLVVKTSGDAQIWGYDIETDMREARRSIGIVPQELNIDPFFTPYELLDLYAGLYGVAKKDRRTDDILKAVGLGDKRNAYARSLSGGMRRRLLVGKALVHAPRILVLDEPTAGVDVELRRQLWDYVRELNANGTTILLTTHYLQEAEELCDQIAIINHGRVIKNASTKELMKHLDSKEMIIQVDRDLDSLPTELEDYNVDLRNPRELVFSYAPSTTNSGEILSSVQNAGINIVDVATHEAELEDVFLSLTSGPDTGDD
ncbi:MAG: ABC transporter ATP-binding protein [Rhodospirillales bacterium]|jgi:ABC-2 type transport system ATP-binding protein|nr:ABC transporter ATP-binding protein [Rhodospirillales bacterium]